MTDHALKALLSGHEDDIKALFDDIPEPGARLLPTQYHGSRY